MKTNINKGLILSVASNTDVYARGEIYYKTGKVQEFFSEQEEAGTVMKAVIEGNYKKYKVNVLFDSEGRLKGYKCSCESHSIWRGACKHVVAALFAALTDGPIKNDRALMSAAAKEVADAFEKHVFQEIDGLYCTEEESGQIIIEPIMHITTSDRSVSVELSIGNGRLYTVKNISELLHNIRTGATVSYGKNLRFCHNYQVFDATSRKLITFLEKEDQIYTEVSKSLQKRYGYYMYGRENPRYMPLSTHNLDSFIGMFMGRGLRVSFDKASAETVRFTDKMPDIRLDLDYSEDKITVKGPVTDFFSLEGELYHYLYLDGSQHRLTKSNGKMLAPVYSALNKLDGKIIFTGQEVGRFLTIVYPTLRKLDLTGTITGDFEQYNHTEMLPKLYFDLDGKNVECKVSFCYGDEEIDPFIPASGLGLRDAAGEYKVTRMLAGLGFGEDHTKGAYLLKSDELIYDLLHRDMNELLDTAEIYFTDELRSKAERKMVKGVGLRIKGNLLEMSAVNWDFSFNDLVDAMDSYNMKRRFHRLKDGSFLSLDNEEVQAVAEMVSALELTKKDIRNDKVILPNYRALYLDTLIKETFPSDTPGRVSSDVSMDDGYRTLTESFGDINGMSFAVPDKLENILRGYQKIGYSWLKMLSGYGFGGILADDMGLGKTIQVIALLLSEKNEKGEKETQTASLVISPTSLIYNWEKEISRFAPELNTMVISGPAGKRGSLLTEDGIDVFITTYDMLKRDIDIYNELGKEFDYIIADEAQFIKNPQTLNAKAVKSIKGRVRFALTGTPMENALVELWSIFDFVMPGYLYNQSKFTKIYETPIVKNEDREMSKRLQKQTAPFILRRVKRDVLQELPEKTETTLYAEMLPEQKKLYMVNLLKARGELDQVLDEGIYAKSQIKILAQLTRLRQICCHPALFVDNYTGGSGKLELAIETAERAVESGHRLLIFSQFTSMLSILKSAFDEKGITYYYLDGATESKLRSEMADKFNAGGKDAFLISLKAGGTGLNLTGADVVIHYDPWWNPAVMDQASDRAHRYGQRRAVQVFNLVAKDSIEDKIMTLQSKKRDLIDSVITEGASFISKMSQEDIKELFSE